MTNNGIDHWTDASYDVKVIERPRIQGYRTIQVQHTGESSGPHEMCTRYVDVADDQSLRAISGTNDPDDPPTCDVARQFADAAITSLANQV